MTISNPVKMQKATRTLTLLVEMKNGIATLENFQFLIKLTIITTVPSNVIPGYLLPKSNKRKKKIYVHIKICTGMFIVALFVITKTGNNTGS